MSNLAIYSDNAEFADDLALQVAKYVPELMIADGKEILPDIAVVDENYETFMQIRALYKKIPLIYLYSSDCKIKENSLNIALKKPMTLLKFLDILRSANNKLDASENGYLHFGVYELRPIEKEIENLNNGNITKLTEKEISIIKYLYKHNHTYVSKGELQKNVWKYNDEVSTHTVETHIYRLRRKVEKNGAPQLVLTEKGGYKLGVEQ